ncbi:helix-turn-helix domain-containing protein [Acidipila sp. EB88]|uniref:helix-turn-helix domain-containing protein n=1 Tax=Acidipila sp. EB88 TaxID=2305226 RepID=UPI000F5E37EC|nr:helix-turn-helix domain-containing protein [Acidipila sp. EB88]RRA49166.1 hypothetical protein D1Y84_13690 [Acidipila sp. EB88]
MSKNTAPATTAAAPETIENLFPDAGKKGAGFFFLYESITRASLCVGPERSVLLELAHSANASEGFSCYPSYATIARYTGLSEATCRLAVRGLESKKLVRRIFRGKQSNRFVVNYRHIMAQGQLARLVLKAEAAEAKRKRQALDFEEFEVAETIEVMVAPKRGAKDKVAADRTASEPVAKPTKIKESKPAAPVAPTPVEVAATTVALVTPVAPKAEPKVSAPIECPVYDEEYWVHGIKTMHSALAEASYYAFMPTRLHAPVAQYISQIDPSIVVYGCSTNKNVPCVLLSVSPCELASMVLSTEDKAVKFGTLPARVSQYHPWEVCVALRMFWEHPDNKQVRFILDKAANRAAALSAALPALIEESKTLYTLDGTPTEATEQQSEEAIAHHWAAILEEEQEPEEDEDQEPEQEEDETPEEDEEQGHSSYEELKDAARGRAVKRGYSEYGRDLTYYGYYQGGGVRTTSKYGGRHTTKPTQGATRTQTPRHRPSQRIARRSR